MQQGPRSGVYRHPIGTPGLRVHTGFHAVAFRVGGGEGRKVAPDENRPQPGGGPETVTADGGAIILTGHEQQRFQEVEGRCEACGELMGTAPTGGESSITIAVS
jgi:hypothetical protein